MLNNAMMGALALAILWVNTLLIAGAALQELARLRRRAAALGAVVLGEVSASEHALAELRVDQVGRKTDRGSIVFSDRTYTSEVLGGALEVNGERRELEPGAALEVWLSPDEVEKAAAPASEQAFQAALKEASRARGFARTIRATIEPGARVFLGDGVLATFDPRAWLAKRSWLVVGFVILDLVLAGACTAIALVPPVFGTISTIGGALGLAFFLSVQAVGTSVRDAVRSPAQRVVRGVWEPSGTKASRVEASNAS